MEFIKVILFLVIASIIKVNAKSLARFKRDRLFEYKILDKFIMDMAIPSLQLSISECLYQTSPVDQLKCVESSLLVEFNSFAVDSMKIKHENPELFQDYFKCIDSPNISTKDCQLKVEEIRSEFYQSLIDEFKGDKNHFKDQLINSQLDLILWKIHLCSHQQRTLSNHESRQLKKVLKTFFSS